MGKARISGLDRQRIEVGGVGAFDQAETPEEVVAAMFKACAAEGTTFTETERENITAMVMELGSYIAACSARPTPAILPDKAASPAARLSDAERHRQLKARLNGRA